MRRLTAAAMAAAAFAGQAATVPYFPSASDPDRQGFVRAINHSAIAGEVSIAATDDAGMALDPVALPIAGNETVHFNSDDLETGSETKGIRGIGGGQGDWRLEIASDVDVEALAYVRTNDGFLTSMLESFRASATATASRPSTPRATSTSGAFPGWRTRTTSRSRRWWSAWTGPEASPN